MPKRLTHDEFVQRSRLFHGDIYEYLSNYKQNKEKIEIYCKKHNRIFFQMPCEHYKGTGCPDCIIEKRGMTEEEFIRKAKLIHGDEYGYNELGYINGSREVSITCFIHGIFKVIPRKHIYKKYKCPGCCNNKRLKFIEKANKIHNNKFDYSESDFISYKDSKKLKIKCPIHGIFYQSAIGHILGYGCKKCADSQKRSTREKFIEKAKFVHGDEYDYSLLIYENNKKEVGILCKKHGLFFQRPLDHLRGSGCHACAIENDRLTQEEFIEKAKLVHGDEYDHSMIKYTRLKDKVTIICKKHGPVEILAGNYLQGSRCGKCANELNYMGFNEYTIFYPFVQSYFKTYTIIPQYSVDRNYKSRPFLIDFVIPELNLAIEYDESNHKYRKKYDKYREEYIKNKTGLKFIRVDDKRFIKEGESYFIELYENFKKDNHS